MGETSFWLLLNILAIFFGVATAYILFTFRSKWLLVLPKDDNFLQRYKIKRKIHLRHLIEIAILTEEEGKYFYDKFAEKALSINVKNLCRKLAQSELEHKEFFQKILTRWLPLAANSESLRALLKDLKVRGVFLNPPSAQASEEDMARYALGQEYKTIDFYRSFETAFPREWKRLYIEKIAEEEKSHADKLVAAYPDLKI